MMPSPIDMLQELVRMSEEQRPAAVLWHGALAAVLLALAFGFRPRLHQARVALVAPLASVSVFAWSYGNPFSGSVFALWAALLAMLGTYRPSARRVVLAALPAAVAGLVLIAFGSAYPGVGRAASSWRMLIEAPVGVIPCPTLAVVVGLALAGGGLGSAAWSLALGALGFFYGFVGAWYLGVAADWVLCIGSVLLSWTALTTEAGA